MEFAAQPSEATKSAAPTSPLILVGQGARTIELLKRYVDERAEVIISEQEVRPDLPRYAITIASNPDHWVDCWPSPPEAAGFASLLGFRVGALSGCGGETAVQTVGLSTAG